MATAEPRCRPASSFSDRTRLREAEQTQAQVPTAARALLADFHGLLVVGAKEAVGAVLFDGLPAVLPDVEHCGDKGGNLS